MNKAEEMIENRLVKLAEKIPSAVALKQKYELVLNLDHVILSGVISLKAEENIYDHLDGDTKRLIQSLYVAFETDIENSIDQLININKNNASFLFDKNVNVIVPYFQRYINLVKCEQNNLKVSSNDKVLWIGSGPFPSSAMILNSMVHCHIDCVDVSKVAINKSGSLFKNLGLSNSIKVINSNGDKVDSSQYDKILVGVLASPINPVMQNIIKRAKSTAVILKRVTYGLRKLIYPTVPITIPMNDYTSNIRYKASGDQVISHVIYTPNRPGRGGRI